ncbi:hypothetical protein SJ059_30400, partial [Klebsiella aerogenes]|nr:hypothetical protein [Klebsiella aerogenes]
SGLERKELIREENFIAVTLFCIPGVFIRLNFISVNRGGKILLQINKIIPLRYKNFIFSKTI